MKPWLELFLFISVVSLVDSSCQYSYQSREDVHSLCAYWLYKGHGYRHANKKMTCVTLIEEKCPKMITVVKKSIKREYDTKFPHYDTCTNQVRNFIGNGEVYMEYLEKEYKPLCSDDDGQFEDCTYWWSIVRRQGVEDTYKEVCINRILKHCKSNIYFIDGTPVDDEQHNRKGYRSLMETYDCNGEKGSFYHWVPQNKY